MNKADFQLRGVGDPRLAVHATSSLPAWLWSLDGSRILWANPVGAQLFGATNAGALATRTFGPADPHKRQVAQLIDRLPLNGAIRLERLRGFGAALGRLVTCACMKLEFADGGSGILIAAAEPIGRSMPLVERLKRLVEGIDTPIAAFARDGMFVGASDAARALLGFRNLSDAGLESAGSDALKNGRVETPVGIGHMVLQRVGSGADVGLVALLAPGVVHAPAPKLQPAPPAHVETPAVAEPPHPEAAQPDGFADVAAADDAHPAEPTESPIEPPFELQDPFEERLTVSGEQDIEEDSDEDLFEPPTSANSAEIKHPIDHVADPIEMTTHHATARDSAPAETPQAPTGESVETIDELLADAASTPHDQSAAEVADEPAAPRDRPIDQVDEPIELITQHAVERASEADLPHEAIVSHTAPEPPPYVEAVADGPQTTAPQSMPESEIETSLPAEASPHSEEKRAVLPAWFDEPTPATRRHPLRFMWQMDAEGRFTLGSDEFTRLIGTQTAAAFGRLWTEIADVFGLDPAGRVAEAVATRNTWSGVTLKWPVDGGERLPVELSGLPIFDRERNFVGYRGFGVCRDLDGLSKCAAQRRNELFNDPRPRSLSADIVQAGPAADTTETSEIGADRPAPIAEDPSHSTNSDLTLETPMNVVPFRPTGDVRQPSLTPVENNAFNELARQLSARLEAENGLAPADHPMSESEEHAAPESVAESSTDEPHAPEPAEAFEHEQATWLQPEMAPPHGVTQRDKPLLDLLPVGVLISRLDRLVYANNAFLKQMGYASLQALEEAGGLDALMVEPSVSGTSSTSDTGTPVTISVSQPTGDMRSSSDAHLFTIAWDGEPAQALIFAMPREGAGVAEAIAAAVPAQVAAPVAEAPSAVGHANAEELGAILDTAAEGIVMFDETGRINSCNRSAEALFGYDGSELVQRNLADLFAPESQRVVLDYLEAIKGAGVASLLDHGREALGRVREGGFIPLSMTMGRTRADGPNFFAVFRDLSQSKKNETELMQARRQAERAASAKSDVLARISHEVRTPLNAIIGFAEVMIDERFGALGNERYSEYMKDIRASGERVIAVINDMLDLSRIETGKLDLAFTSQNLNELVEQCVAVMQPQANRERIIIRTSLAHTLPPVVADARALRQIALNLIGNSIHLANAGGQVIVSTALTDFGDVVLRVRDTGHGLNDNEVAAAMEPFRTSAPSDQTNASGVSLSLTKALVEANRAQFQIKTAPHSGTLIEVVFSQAMARV